MMQLNIIYIYKYNSLGALYSLESGAHICNGVPDFVCKSPLFSNHRTHGHCIEFYRGCHEKWTQVPSACANTFSNQMGHPHGRCRFWNTESVFPHQLDRLWRMRSSIIIDAIVVPWLVTNECLIPYL